MAERIVGSGVCGIGTVATLLPPTSSTAEEDVGDTDAQGMPLGPWGISGFKTKRFPSVADANMAVLLARTAKGISLFYAPTRRLLTSKNQSGTLADGKENGMTIQRLKPRMGTNQPSSL
ncbi:hypothetical protein EG328_011739 [Venturia inaequalis]|uniref:Uncharacterized protein n=1 Tax=Venturia inaequalis TaxID=5025 RepID=A0A8H3U559_VENIN|nr:hypothetical protein EG328_011739 [Venturia inaequalis]KAE9969389.1 hypothetical protein EG327_010653 [Venturia inaequalis]